MTRQLTAGLAGLLAGTLVLLSAPGASAGSDRFADARDDVRSPNDIVATTIWNSERIGVRIEHDDLRRNAIDIAFKVQPKGWTAYVGLDGTNQTVYKYRDGVLVTRDCRGLKVAKSWRNDWTKLSVPRRCVGNPGGRVRLRSRVQWTEGGKGDWSFDRAGDERDRSRRDHFSRWIRR